MTTPRLGAGARRVLPHRTEESRMVESTSQSLPGAAYLLVLLGIVIGAASVLAMLVWRKALQTRERERYFSDVRALARGGR